MQARVYMRIRPVEESERTTLATRVRRLSMESCTMLGIPESHESNELLVILRHHSENRERAGYPPFWYHVQPDERMIIERAEHDDTRVTRGKRAV